MQQAYYRPVLRPSIILGKRVPMMGLLITHNARGSPATGVGKAFFQDPHPPCIATAAFSSSGGKSTDRHGYRFGKIEDYAAGLNVPA
jgi:hypothetical protein